MKKSLHLIVLLCLFVLSACAHQGGQMGETLANHQELGRQAFDLGDFETAVKHLEQAKALESEPSETNTLLGLSYSALNRYSDAISVLGEGPHIPTAEHAFALGSALVAEGRSEDGIAWLKQAVAIDPELKTLYQVSDGTADPNAAVEYMQVRTREQQVQEEILESILQDTKDQLRQDIREQIAEDLILGR